MRLRGSRHRWSPRDSDWTNRAGCGPHGLRPGPALAAGCGDAWVTGVGLTRGQGTRVCTPRGALVATRGSAACSRPSVRWPFGHRGHVRAGASCGVNPELSAGDLETFARAFRGVLLPALIPTHRPKCALEQNKYWTFRHLLHFSFICFFCESSGCLALTLGPQLALNSFFFSFFFFKDRVPSYYNSLSYSRTCYQEQPGLKLTPPRLPRVPEVLR